MNEKKMTLYEFRLLPLIDQQELVYIHGTFIDIQLAPPYFRLTLYALDQFFVEVRFNLETKKTVEIKGFNHGKIMDKYLGGNLS